ncbi:MAG TPA: VanZ family protein [Azospirillaceae bacterium]|nr:VanZ family protein [Azospirillaceae bacterium]
MVRVPDTAPHADVYAKLLLISALIAYASFHPFEVRLDAAASGLQELVRLRGLTPLLGDSVVNVVMFIPFGAVAAHIRASPGMNRAPLADPVAGWVPPLLWGGLFAFALQVVQIVMPARHPSMLDVGFNLVGIAVGMAACRLAGAKGLTTAQIVPGILLALWLVHLTAPILVWFRGADLAGFAAAGFGPGAFARALVGWLVACRLCASLGVRTRWLVPAVAGAALAAAANRLSGPGALAGAAVAVALWPLVRDRRVGDGWFGLLVAALLAADTFRAVAPFGPAARVNWLPFAPLLRGNELGTLAVLSGKLFAYGALLWFSRDVRPRPGWAGPTAVAAYVAALEVAQAWNPKEIADTTDPLMVLALAILAAPVRRPGMPAPGASAHGWPEVRNAPPHPSDTQTARLGPPPRPGANTPETEQRGTGRATMENGRPLSRPASARTP